MRASQLPSGTCGCHGRGGGARASVTAALLCVLLFAGGCRSEPDHLARAADPTIDSTERQDSLDALSRPSAWTRLLESAEMHLHQVQTGVRPPEETEPMESCALQVLRTLVRGARAEPALILHLSRRDTAVGRSVPALQILLGHPSETVRALVLERLVALRDAR